jgi:hypothetical protein
MKTKTKSGVQLTVKKIIDPAFRQAFTKLTLVNFINARLSWNLALCVNVIDETTKTYNQARTKLCQRLGLPRYDIPGPRRTEYLQELTKLGDAPDYEEVYSLQKKFGEVVPDQYVVPTANAPELQRSINGLESVIVDMPLKFKLVLPSTATQRPEGMEAQALTPLDLFNLQDIILPPAQ